MRSIEYQPIFEATRGDLVESIHYGAFAVVNDGNLLASWGILNRLLICDLLPSLSRQYHSWKTRVMNIMG